MTPHRYLEFVQFVFDRPVPARGVRDYWYFGTNFIDFSASDSEIVELYGHLFRNCGIDLRSYSDDQVGLGLKYLLDNGCSDLVLRFRDGKTAAEWKAAAIRNLYFVYRDCFENRCKATLGHLSQTGDGALSYICYMLWDISPMGNCSQEAEATSQALLPAVLSVMEEALYLSNDACVESALHGLGHIALHHPQHAEEIIDRLLSKRTNLRAELVQYAQSARTGRIL